MPGDESPADAGLRRGNNKRKRDVPISHSSGKISERSTPLAYARRTPPPDSSRATPDETAKSDDDGNHSPPRKLKRPGASSRIRPDGREAAERARKQREEEARKAVANRHGSSAAAVAQHYNAVPQFGREWRQAGSKISGLRNFNNWIKSTLIQKFSRPEIATPTLRVLDMACGKGGDLGKWEKAPQTPALYVGCDIASISIEQARERYSTSLHKRRGPARGKQMQAEFYVHDTFGHSLAEVPTVRAVGFDPNAGSNQNIVYPQGAVAGFDVVSIMFALHYSFETEQLARGMLQNVAGALKKGGKFFGVMPNSDLISANVRRLLAAEEVPKVSDGIRFEGNTDNEGCSRLQSENNEDNDEDEWDPEKPSEAVEAASRVEDDVDDWNPEEPSEPVATETTTSTDPHSKDAGAGTGADADAAEPANSEAPPDRIQWGNSIYKINFSRDQPLVGRPLPRDGIFRPPFGWRYHYSLEEAVDAPEYVVPWEAFRALAEDFGLELMYRKGFREVFEDESGDRELGMLAERMHVMSRDRSQGKGGLLVSSDEMEAASFYHAFCFYKT